MIYLKKDKIPVMSFVIFANHTSIGNPGHVCGRHEKDT